MWLKSLTKASFVVSLTLSSLPAWGAIVTYSFTVTPDSGPLLGNPYEGSFAYDDASLTGVGAELLPESALTSIKFDFNKTTYTQADALSAGVEFLEGEFLGLSYITDASFSIDGVEFSYDLDSGAGFGDVSYQLEDTPIPEPSFILTSLGLGLAGGVRRLRR